MLKMLDAAVHAPSPKHQQNWHFVVVQNKDTIEKMADDVKYRVW
ncbi:nitroreductase family protein [uncultured Clostridium sp.]